MSKRIFRRNHTGKSNIVLLGLLCCLALKPEIAWSWNADLTATPNLNDGNYTLTWSPAGSGPYRLFVRANGESGATQIWSGNDSTNSFSVINQLDGDYEHWLSRRYTVCSGGGRGGCEYFVETSEPIIVRVNSGPPPVLDPPQDQAAYTYEVRVGDINGDGLQDAHIFRTSGDPDNGVIAEQIIQRLSTNDFVLLNANLSELNQARLWPLASNTDVVPANLNLDNHVDIVVRGLSGANSQVLISSGDLYDPQASELGEIDDEARRFIRDTKEFMRDTNYFDTAQFPDEDGYNIRIDVVVGSCVLIFGFPFCSDYNYTLVDIDVSLDDLGLDGFLSVQSKLSPGGVSLDTVGAYYAPEVNAAAEPLLSEQNISDLHAYTSEMDVAMQKLGPSLPDISGDPDVLQCVFFCGGLISYFSNGYSYVYWVDTWTPITIPGGFDDVNYSQEAYELAQEMEIFAPHYGAILANPAAQRALERGVVWVIAYWELERL